LIVSNPVVYADINLFGKIKGCEKLKACTWKGWEIDMNAMRDVKSKTLANILLSGMIAINNLMSKHIYTNS